LQKNPWDEELKSLASVFGKLLREIVVTVDCHGLKKRHLGRHKRGVDDFFDWLTGAEYRSEVAEGYRKRLLKYPDKLFTFIDYDGVPWNNNNAEHAVKKFAYYREIADGQFSEEGLKEYLILLSVYQTCQYKGAAFLKFLLSREADIDVFCQRRGGAVAHPLVELRPEGVTFSRRKGNQGSDHEPQEK
jgi:hypothetical protein